MESCRFETELTMRVEESRE